MVLISKSSTVNVALLLSTLIYYGHCQTAPPEPRVPPSIAFGNPTDVGEFPFVVNIEKFDDYYGEWLSSCTGSLIDSRTVLTAAHCITSLSVNYEYEYCDYNAIDDYGGCSSPVPSQGGFTSSKTGNKSSNVKSGDKKKGKGKNKKGSKGKKKNKGGQKYESATCIIHKGPSLRVLVGNNSTATKNAVQRGVARVVPHPMYVKDVCTLLNKFQAKVGYDIGLLFLDSPIDNLKTIQLSTHKVEIGEKTYPLGYGTKAGYTDKGALTKTLSVAKKCPSNLSTSADMYCGAANRTGTDYREAFKKFKGIDAWSEDLTEEFKKYIDIYHGNYSAVCGGDSGGPALMNLPKQSLASLTSWQQVGINSWGTGVCGFFDSKSTVGYTKVADYIGWIRRTVSSYYKEKLPLAKMFNPLQRHSSSGVHLVPGPPPSSKGCKSASVKTDRCKSTFYPLPQVKTGNGQRHLIGVSSSSARSIAKYFCESLYFNTAGAIGTFKVKKRSKQRAYNLMNGQTCSGDSCHAIGIVECVPHGAKRCPKDRRGNIGSKNQGGSNNIGNGNSGDNNWGSCNKSKNNIGYNGKGVSNK